MAAPTYVDSAVQFGFSSTAGDNGVDTPLAIPGTATAGDTAILTVTARLAGTPPVPAAPTGWTAIEVSNVGTASGGRLYIYTTEVGSDAAVDPGEDVTLTLSTSTGWTASVVVVSPADVDDIGTDFSVESAGSDQSPAATASDDALVLYIHGSITTPNGAQITIDADASTTERTQACTNATGGQRNAVQMIASETVTAGAVPTRTVTMTQVGDVSTSSWQQQAVTVVLTEQVDRPVADAGDDQTVGAGEVVNLDGSATDGGGAGSPYTYQWTQTSGTAVSLSDDTAEDPTFTAPGESAVLVFELVVTDSGSVASNADSVTITVLGPEDTSQPNSDETVAGWTPSTGADNYAVLSDNSDATYTTSPDAPSSEVLRVGMSALTDAAGTDTVTLSVRASRQNASSASCTIALVEGASTVIATSGPHSITGSTVQQFDLVLSEAEIDSITDFADLDVQVTVTAAA